MTFTVNSLSTTVENICKLGVFGCSEGELDRSLAENDPTITFDLLADTAKHLELPAGTGTCAYFVSQISKVRRWSDDREMLSDANFSSVFAIDVNTQMLNVSLPDDWANQSVYDVRTALYGLEKDYYFEVFDAAEANALYYRDFSFRVEFEDACQSATILP